MKRIGCRLIYLVLFFGFIFLSPVCANSNVAIVKIQGEIDAGQTALVYRALHDAKANNYQAVIFEIDTFGGLVDSAVKIRDMIIDTPIVTICHVKNRAWSAGALIAIANKHIVVSPGGSIGAAEPIPATEKNIAALKAEFAATANKTGRNPRVAEAMVDKSLGFEDFAKPGQILALTDYQATKAGYADIVTPDVTEILAFYQLSGANIISYTPEFNEKAAGFFANTTVKSILLSIVVLAILTEIKTAGMGVAAAIGILAAVLFFSSQWLIGVGGWLEILLFISGLVLVGIEFFIPGITIFGVAGTVAILASFFIALGGNVQALNILALSLLIGFLMFAVIVKRLPSSRLWAKLVLQEAETEKDGFVSTSNYAAYLGKEGTALSSLRPAGIVAIDGVKLDVVTEGIFLPSGTTVRVVSVSGNRIVVKKIS